MARARILALLTTLTFFPQKICSYTREYIPGYLNAYQKNTNGQGVFLALLTDDPTKTLSLAQIGLVQGLILPQTTIDDGEQVEKNPLHGACINQLKLASILNHDYPIVTIDEQPHSLYLVDFYQTGTTTNHLSHLSDCLDANKMPGEIFDICCVPEKSKACVAIKPAGKKFGESGTGIALVKYGSKTDNETRFAFLEHNTERTSSDVAPEIVPATSLTGTVIDINGKAHITDETITMHWDGALDRLFIGLHVQAGPHANDGCCGVLVGRFEQQRVENPAFKKYEQEQKEAEEKDEKKEDASDPPPKFLTWHTLHLEPIASPDLFINAEHIVAARGAHACVSIHTLRTMHTSTRLPYLIVHGGNGQATKNGNRIYALPLFREYKRHRKQINNSSIGTLASTVDAPSARYRAKAPYGFKERMRKQALQPGELFTIDDPQAQVGGGPLPIEAWQSITDLVVEGDTVVATIADSDNEKSGVFSSRALFDQTGAIISWTPWQRAAGVTKPCHGYIRGTNNQMFLITDSNRDNHLELRSCGWSNNANLSARDQMLALQNVFTQQEGGIVHMCNDQHANLIVAIGRQRILLVDTHQTHQAHDEEINIHDIDVNNLTAIRVLNGLQDIAPGTCAATAQSDAGSYIFVGGSRGVGVISDDQNRPLAVTSLADINRHIQIAPIADCSHVRKLVCINDYLYILTFDKLLRMHITELEKPAECIVEAATLTGQNFGSFADAFVFGNALLLATSNGLYACNVQSHQWHHVQLADRIEPVTQLCGMGDARGHVANVYALATNAGREVSHLYRLYINAYGDEPVIGLLPDNIVDQSRTKQITPFLSFAQTRSKISYDGAALLSVHQPEGHANMTSLFAPAAHSKYQTKNEHKLFAHTHVLGNKVYGFMQCPQLGTQFIYGDFGVLAHE